MWSWALAARAATVCVGDGPGCLASLQQALDDPANDTVEINGSQRGPFTVDHPVTLVGLDDAVLRLTVASTVGPLLSSSADLTVQNVVLDANGWGRNLVATGGSTVLDRVVLLRGRAARGARGCAVVDGRDLVVTDSLIVGCRHLGTEAGLWANVDSATLTGTTLRDNDGPALQLAADTATLDALEVARNGLRARGKVGGLYLADVASLSLTRSWFCDNVGHRGGALRIERGCVDGDCRLAHDVFQGNRARVGGAVMWGGADGVLEHATFVDNRARTAARAIAVVGGQLDVDRSLVVEGPGLAVRPRTFETWVEGAVRLTGSAVAADRPGFPLGPDNLALDAPPDFAGGFVGPACGPSVTFDPTVPANAPFVGWPDADAIGALTTADCGPWCEDLDLDGIPAMWDCADDDPSRAIGAEELGGDGIDQDCDGRDVCFSDPDGDGWGSEGTSVPLGQDCPDEVPRGGDCDEGDPGVHPGATEIPGDGRDTDCDGFELCFADADGDGVTGRDRVPGDLGCTEAGLGPTNQEDCDDTDPARRGAYCAVQVTGGCHHAPAAGGGLAWLGLALVRRRHQRRANGCATARR